MTKFIVVGVGGFFGSIARFWVGGYVSNRWGTRFPYGTFVINMSASFLIGLVITLLAEKAHWNPNWRYLIPIGFIGAYSTFSTFEYETLRNFEDGQIIVAFLNITLSVFLGFMAVWCGVIVGRKIA
jgi:fluoride exporter